MKTKVNFPLSYIMEIIDNGNVPSILNRTVHFGEVGLRSRKIRH